MHESYQLKNKANICLIPQLDTKSVTVLVMYPVGSRYESEKMQGVSHYIEHLMFKGTKKRSSTLILTREIDRLGANYNAFTGKEYTGYYIKVDADYTRTAVDILSDMLFDSKFDAREMEREKTVIVEEIKMYKDNPMMNIENIFEELLFDGCPMGRDIAGTEKHVLGYKRENVLKFRDRHYEPANMQIVVAGKITDETKECIEEYFGSRKNRKNINTAYEPAHLGSSQKEKRIRLQAKDTDQAQLMIGWPGFKYADKRNAASVVLNTILGGSMSSRLFIKIRERMGLAYMVRSGADSFRDTGYVYVRVGLDPKNINKVIEVIKEEIKKMVKKGVTKRELADAKTNIHGSVVLSMEDSSSLANWYATRALFYDKIESPDDVLKKIDAVTSEDIDKVVKQIFKMDQMRVAIIGAVEKDSVKY
ncbi:insulinase family protein [Patescibacteria group bacterium]|nr:insulinase family protein [Patescibacteria group bacterium]